VRRIAMPRIVKPIAETVLGNRLAFSAVSSIRRPSALVLAFHNVLPEGVRPRGDRSLHLSAAAFREIIDWLPELFDVVPLDEVFVEPGAQFERPRAAITFDDAYAGAISVGIPELQRRGLPATVFVVSGAESGQTFWWDALADGFPDGLSQELREAALTKAQGRDEEVRRWAHEHDLPTAEMPGAFVSASWETIEQTAALPGVTIGSHTRTHANLSVLDRTDLVTELVESRRDLATKLPSTRPWLAYPYGRYSSAVEQASEHAGYEFAFRVDGGTVLNRDNNPPPHRLPRLNIPAGLTLSGFRLRAAGLLGR
jgi:peptidoglycan/xylan/chitin deacetylase (PgdA/CDA1 family)